MNNKQQKKLKPLSQAPTTYNVAGVEIVAKVIEGHELLPKRRIPLKLFKGHLLWKECNDVCQAQLIKT